MIDPGGSKSGWIKLHRQIWDNPRSVDPDWIAVWVYLLSKSTHKTLRRRWCGKEVILQPGQCITGRKEISKTTGVEESKVKRLLDVLKRDQQIDRQRGNQSSIITVRNWAEYQSGDQPNDQPNDQPMTSQWPADDQPVTTNKNIKNIENGRIEEPESMSGNAAPMTGGASGSATKTAQGPVQWNSDKFPTLPHLKEGLRRLKENDQLHLNDSTDFFDLLREVLGDEHVNQWQNCWSARWRENSERCRAAFSGLVDDLLNRPAENGIRNPAGHLNDVWKRIHA